MQTGLIAYPIGDRFIRVHTSMLIACQGNQCAAALISFLEGWHNYRIQQIEYTALYNAMLIDNAFAPIIDTSGWQYHTNEQLERGVLLWKTDTIYKASDFLESLGFISSDVPERLIMLHKTGRTKWFLLMVDQINSWIREFETKLGHNSITIPRPKRGVRQVKESDNLHAEIEEIFTFRAIEREKYWTAEKKPYVKDQLTPKRAILIRDRLLDFSIADLKLAVLGNLSSKWHQGENNRKKVYDGIEFVFKNTERIENAIKEAMAHGITHTDLDLTIKADKEIERNLDAAEAGYNATLADVAVKIIIGTAQESVVDRLIVKLLPLYEPLSFSNKIFINRAEAILENTLGMFTDEHRDLLNFITEELECLTITPTGESNT